MPRTSPTDIQRLLDYCIEKDDPRAVKEIFKVDERDLALVGCLLNSLLDHQRSQDGSRMLYKRREISTDSRRISCS